MLAIDSLVTDLIFKREAELDPEVLVTALGGEEIAATRQILDPDMQDPRFEMELSPSMPFRQRGERRLMIVDDSVAPMREDPRTDPIVPLDLRPEKARLIELCRSGPIRLGRLFALGSWGSAVIVAHTARDLRAICLLPWALDPTIDLDGRRRANQLTSKEFEAKLLSYEQRLDELSDDEILANIGDATLVRDGDLLVVDVLEADGTWDVRRSIRMEDALAAVDKFSLITGAPSGGAAAQPAGLDAAAGPVTSTETAMPAVTSEVAENTPVLPKNVDESGQKTPVSPQNTPVRATELDGTIVLQFTGERFDLDTAAALGKGDYDAVLRSHDLLSGQQRDRVYEHGAEFVAPLEFLSEVFIDGVPLARPTLDEKAETISHGVRTLEVHCPRFGPALLLVTPDGDRFISSKLDNPAGILRVLSEG